MEATYLTDCVSLLGKVASIWLGACFAETLSVAHIPLHPPPCKSVTIFQIPGPRNFGDPLGDPQGILRIQGDPQGILRGSYPKMWDPAFA